MEGSKEQKKKKKKEKENRTLKEREKIGKKD